MNMSQIRIVPNEFEGDLEQPVRQVCLPLMISPLCFKVEGEDAYDSDSCSDESIDMDDYEDEDMCFDFTELMTKLPDQSSRFTQGDMAPKYTMVEVQGACNFPDFDKTQFIVVDDSEEEEQITSEPVRAEGEDDLLM